MQITERETWELAVTFALVFDSHKQVWVGVKLGPGVVAAITFFKVTKFVHFFPKTCTQPQS